MLTGDEIRRLGIVSPGQPLADEQVQVNGIDLTLDAVWSLHGTGSLGRADADRRLPDREPLAFDEQGWVDLPSGVYGIRFVEPVDLPADCGGLAFPRSSLLRMGAFIPTAVWDAGYRGRAETLIWVGAGGVRVQRGARIAQLVLFRLPEATVGYAGAYQGENL